MTHAQLRKTARRWVPYWRDRLGLRDWHVDVVYETLKESDGSLAHVVPSFPDRHATIKVLNAQTEDARETWKGEDAEVVLVHELLHIHLMSLGVSGGDYRKTNGVNKTVLAEQVINALAQCLVDRRRGKK